MQTRLLLPNRVTDARWGYLDKFDANPHLRRAFLISMGIALTGLVAGYMATPGTVSLRPAPEGITMPGNLMPAPRFEPVVRPHPAPRLRVRPAGRRPVPAPVADDSWDPAAASGANVSPPPDAAAQGDGVEDAPVPGGATGAPQWPDPDTFVPVEQEPLLLSIPSPAYPELARDAGIDGTVLVRVLVGEDGFVKSALILQSVLGLDDAALGAARAAVFRPALQQQRPVAVWIVVPIEFRLHG